jgi:hypothetical protein
MRVLIQGDGAAARCSAHLLIKAGVQVEPRPVARQRVPAIMLSDAAVDMMRDVFGRPDLFRSAPRIRKRIVRWGNTTTTEVAHSAIVVSEEEILTELSPSFIPQTSWTGIAEERQFTIYTARPVPDNTREERFGSRTAQALPVQLTKHSDVSCCWIEALEAGWLFLVPGKESSAWMLAVGAPAKALLSESRLIAATLSDSSDSGAHFLAAPRVLASLGGEDWLACGSAAMAFDPICGDGTAHAIREAILAAAVVKAIAEGGDVAALIAHYQKRLLAGFQRHLRFCTGFYRYAPDAPWWRREAEALEEGLAWCTERIDPNPKFSFQLRGFQLQPVACP